MPNDRSPRTHHPRPARLALQVRDAGSSGVIDVADLRAEPLAPSLASSLVRPGAAPSPPRRHTWPMLALGSTLALGVAFVGFSAALRLAPSTVSERASGMDAQLSMHEASRSPTAHALRPAPVQARSRAPARDRAAGEPLAASSAAPSDEAHRPEAEAIAAMPTKPAPAKLAAARSRDASPSSPAKRPTAAAAAKPRSERGSAILVECVLDPARCGDGAAPPSRPAPTGASSRPAPLPEKLSAAQLKQALATTKADARRCGPDHGADAGTTVRVQLSIEGTSGSVLSATPQGEHTQGPLGRCVALALGQTQFPRFTAKRMGTLYSVRL